MVAKTAHTWDILTHRADQVFQSCEKMSSSSTAACEKYTCQICGYQASQKTHLKLHSQAAHEGRTFQCTEQKSNLMTHQKSELMGKKFLCPDCDYESGYKSAIVSHQKSVHFDKKINVRQL